MPRFTLFFADEWVSNLGGGGDGDGGPIVVAMLSRAPCYWIPNLEAYNEEITAHLQAGSPPLGSSRATIPGIRRYIPKIATAPKQRVPPARRGGTVILSSFKARVQ